MEEAYSDDPEDDAYAAGVAAGSRAPTGSTTDHSTASVSAPDMVKVVDVDDDNDDEDGATVEAVEQDPEVQLALCWSMDSFRVERARQKELSKQEAADLEQATKESLIYARRKRYRDGAASSTDRCH